MLPNNILPLTRRLAPLYTPTDLDNFLNYAVHNHIGSIVLQFDQLKPQDHEHGWKSYIVKETLLGYSGTVAAIQAEGLNVTRLFYSIEDTKFDRPRDMYTDIGLVTKLKNYGTHYASYCVNRTQIPAKVILRKPKLHPSHIPSQDELARITQSNPCHYGKPIPERFLRQLLHRKQ